MRAISGGRRGGCDALETLGNAGKTHHMFNTLGGIPAIPFQYILEKTGQESTGTDHINIPFAVECRPLQEKATGDARTSCCEAYFPCDHAPAFRELSPQSQPTVSRLIAFGRSTGSLPSTAFGLCTSGCFPRQNLFSKEHRHARRGIRQGTLNIPKSTVPMFSIGQYAA